jgi:hypothetical protein
MMITEIILEVIRTIDVRKENHRHCSQFCNCFEYDQKLSSLESDMVQAIADISKATVQDVLREGEGE